MKKIVFKIGQFPHASETFIVAQIITAIKCGYDVKVLVTELLDFETSKQLDLIKNYEIEKKIIIEDYKIPKNKIVRLLKWFFILASNFNNIISIINFHKENTKFSVTWLFQWSFFHQFNEVAIFHAQYGTNSKPLDILKKIGFKPAVVVTFHGHDAFFPINGFIFNNGYYDNLFKYVNLITVNTPYLAKELLELGCPKELLSIIPVGVDTDFFYPNFDKIKPNSTFKLITVGRLDKVKGHAFCIESVCQLIAKGFDVALTIIGEGTERNNLEFLIRKYNLEEKIFLVGKKSQEEIRLELLKHDVYLLAAVALSSGRRETQGLATLEAQACGLPVIVFDSGGVKYTLQNGISGFVCEEYDVDCMVSKVKILIDDFDKYQEMSNNAVAFANGNFSQQLIDSKWKTTYDNLSYGK